MNPASLNLGDRVQHSCGEWGEVIRRRFPFGLTVRVQAQGRAYVDIWMTDVVVARVRAVRELRAATGPALAQLRKDADRTLRAARVCLDPDKMHGAADEFGGSDY